MASHNEIAALNLAPLLLLEVVAGYLYVHNAVPWKYRLARLDGHKLYFYAVAWGLPVLLIAFMLTFAVSCGLGFEFNLPLLTAASLLLAVPLAPCLAWMRGTWPIAARDWLYKALEDNELEQLLSDSIASLSPVMITMDDSKVYIGWVIDVSGSGRVQRRYFRVIPIYSGYRTSEDRSVVLTTTYQEVLLRTTEATWAEASEKFAVVLPIDKVVSARLFDPEAYAQFNAELPAA